MKKRTWDSKTKAKIVLEGLSGKPISELCSQYQISQNQYYQWRDKFLSEAHRAFEGQVGWCRGDPVEGQDPEASADHRGLDGGAKKKRGRVMRRRASASVAARNEAVLESASGVEGGASVLGISSLLGAPALCRQAGGEQEAGLSVAERARVAGDSDQA